MSDQGDRGWRAFFTSLSASERQDVRDILAEDYAAKIRMARQLAEHAKGLARYPDRRARLLAIAAREEEHARWLQEAIERLGGRPPQLGPTSPDARLNWERLILDLQAEKEAYEKFLRDAYGVERDHPEIARLLLRISEEEAAHQQEVAWILGRSDRAALDAPLERAAQATAEDVTTQERLP
jgi:rubrerythrin